MVVVMETDTSLLANARKMDGGALTEIFDLYAPALYKYAFRLCHNSVLADQIVGNVFARLSDQFSVGMGPRANLRPYLFEITHRRVLDEIHYSRRAKTMESVDPWRSDISTTGLSSADRKLIQIMIRAIRNELTEDQRHVLILRFMEDFSVKETALIVGKSVSNVKVIQNRAITILRRALDYKVVETRAISFLIRSMSHA
jgi:RNA polymerase sigma-70 factor (ECF subfamily)